MKSVFEYGPKDDPIQMEDLLMVLDPYMPNGMAQLSRRNYFLVHEDQIREFLEVTKVDKIQWREGMNRGEMRQAEYVCANFSLRLLSLSDDYRVLSGAAYPLAFFRVDYFKHSMNGFVNTKRVFKLVEPQTDEILTPEQWAKRNPTDTTINMVLGV